MGLALAAVLMVGAVGLAQARTSTARARALVEPTQPAMLMVDGKIVETDALDYKREQVMVWLRELENLGWGKISPGEGGEVLFQGNGVTLSFVKGQKIAKVNSLCRAAFGGDVSQGRQADGAAVVRGEVAGL